MTLAEQNRAKTSEAKFMDGTSQTISFQNFKATYKDEYTQEELDDNLTHAAMIDELQYFNDRVWKFMPLAEARKQYPHGKCVGGRWITHNKGDSQSPA